MGAAFRFMLISLKPRFFCHILKYLEALLLPNMVVFRELCMALILSLLECVYWSMMLISTKINHKSLTFKAIFLLLWRNNDKRDAKIKEHAFSNPKLQYSSDLDL